MTAIIAYALSLFINLGVITPAQARNTTNIQIVERDGQTIAIDQTTGSEVIIYM